MELYIEEWEWDEDNIEHLANRGITPELVEEVWLEAPKYAQNLPDRAASHLMVGPDPGGAMWTICILQVADDPATWRAITGWPSSRQQINWYRRAR